MIIVKVFKETILVISGLSLRQVTLVRSKAVSLFSPAMPSACRHFLDDLFLNAVRSVTIQSFFSLCVNCVAFMTLLYACVARGTKILAEGGKKSGIDEIVAALLAKAGTEKKSYTTHGCRFFSPHLTQV